MLFSGIAVVAFGAISLSALVLVVHLISSPSPWASEQERAQALNSLYEHWNRWNRLGMFDYTFTYTREWCLLECQKGTPVVVVVRNLEAAEEDRFVRTVDDLFGQILNVLESEDGWADVVYDSQMGYPTRTAIDYDVHAVDHGAWRYSVEDVKRLPASDK